MPKAILYARFSPRPNAATCESCDVQLADLAEYCNGKGYKIMLPPATVDGQQFGYRDDDTHGDVDARPGLEAAVEALQPGWILIVRDFDRISRATSHRLGVATQIVGKGCRLISTSEGEYLPRDPFQKYLFTILAANGELRRDLTKIATSQGMRRNQRLGRRMGSRTPFGFKDDPTSPLIRKDDGSVGRPSGMMIDPEERTTIERIVALYNEGKSLSQIIARLELNGVKCRGEKWHRGTLSKILRREGVKMRSAGKPKSA